MSEDIWLTDILRTGRSKPKGGAFMSKSKRSCEYCDSYRPDARLGGYIGICADSGKVKGYDDRCGNIAPVEESKVICIPEEVMPKADTGRTGRNREAI